MNYQAMTFWWMAALTIINAIIGLYLWYERRSDATNGRINKIEESMGKAITEFSDRLTSVERDTSHAPTHNDLSKLYVRIAGTEHRLGERIDSVGGAVKRIEGENAAQTRILNLVYESLVK